MKRESDDEAAGQQRDRRMASLGWLVGPAIVVVTVLVLSGCSSARATLPGAAGSVAAAAPAAPQPAHHAPPGPNGG